jgi:hypothetical protein
VAAEAATAVEDVAPEPPPELLPAAIFRQVLFDPAEFTPVWARPRQASAADPATEPSPSVDDAVVASPVATDAPKRVARPRRAKASAAPGGAKTRSKRSAKPKADPGPGGPKPA